jgi:hypothetical protein
VVGALEAVRDALDRLDVVGDVLAGAPVAAGQGADQPAVLVQQVHREPVDLQLAEVVVAVGVRVPRHPGGPGGQLLRAEAVVQAQHPLEVVDGLEVGGEHRTAHLLGRALGRAQRGVPLLEVAQPPNQRVVLPVADRRRVAHVVGELGGAGLLGEIGPLVAGVVGHGIGDDLGHEDILPQRADTGSTDG